MSSVQATSPTIKTNIKRSSGINDIKKVLSVAQHMADANCFDNSLFLLCKKIILGLYRGEFRGGVFLPEIFDFEFSLKIKMASGDIVPSLRFTNYSFYDLAHHRSDEVIDVQKNRYNGLKKVFRLLGLLSEKNKKLLDYAFSETVDDNYVLPIQFAVHLESQNVIVKTYYWCDEKYGLRNIDRMEKVRKILKKFFPKINQSFLDNKEIFFFSTDFKKLEKNIKIYCSYDAYKKVFYDLNFFHFNPKTAKLLSAFIKKYGKFFDVDPIVCFEVGSGGVSIKKVEIFLRKELRNDYATSRRFTDAFLRHFCKSTAVDKLKVSDDFAKHTQVYSIGANFISIYSRLKSWH